MNEILRFYFFFYWYSPNGCQWWSSFGSQIQIGATQSINTMTIRWKLVRVHFNRLKWLVRFCIHIFILPGYLNHSPIRMWQEIEKERNKTSLMNAYGWRAALAELNHFSIGIINNNKQTKNTLNARAKSICVVVKSAVCCIYFFPSIRHIRLVVCVCNLRGTRYSMRPAFGLNFFFLVWQC